jgi:nicotinamide-nucleotide amidase
MPPSTPLRRAAILAVGQELLGTTRLDTNSLWLAARLEEAGISLEEKQVSGDRQTQIEGRMADLLARHDLVVTTGGLGPTADDLTKEAAAALFGRPLVRDESILAALRERFARRGYEMPAINAKQADLVEGAVVLRNPRGTAPGFLVEAGEKILVLLPGVPSEMKAMFESVVLPLLAPRLPGEKLRRRTLRVAGLPESTVDDRAQPVYRRWPAVRFTILASPGDITVEAAVRGESESDAAGILSRVEGELREAIGGAIYGVDDESLEGNVVRLLTERGETLAAAESCTGGFLMKRITDVAGASVVLLGGLVGYSNEAKVRDAEVPAALLEAHGAVSAEVAGALAEGVRRRFGSTWGIGITGIAGPGGGSETKPVGTVHVAVAGEGGTERERLVFPGDRPMIRTLAVNRALDLLRRRLGPEGEGK